jgi:hypothetical protein
LERLAAPPAPAPNAPIQAFGREDLSRAWTSTKRYLDPKNTFGRQTHAASHHGQATDDLAEEVDRSFNVVSPARLLLGKVSPWHRNRPNDVTRSDRDDINRLLQDVHVEGPRRTPNTGLRINTAAVPSEQPKDARLETSRDLVKIAQTGSGRELLRSLHAGGQGRRDRQVGIETQASSESDDPNAGRTDPQSVENLKQGQPTGSNAFYIPSGLRNVNPAWQRDQQNPWNDPRRGDIALYHELVHSHHQQQGGTPDTYGPEGLPPISQGERRDRVDRGVPREEYRTVGLSDRYRNDRFHENRYRQERRELGETAPHRTTYNLVGEEEDEGRFGSGSEEEERPLLGKDKDEVD